MSLLPGKHDLRIRMRQMRRALDDRSLRSTQIWGYVTMMDEMQSAQKIMLYTTIVGEPDVAAFQAWCDATGRRTAVPESDVDPGWPDVVIVPGLAFTAAGERLGQGGGWYDRFLSKVRADTTTIGVGFDPQLVDSIPTELHDVTLDYVVTDAGLAVAR